MKEDGRTPPDDLKETKEQREFEIMEARHQNALVALRIEQLLEQEVLYSKNKNVRLETIEVSRQAQEILSAVADRIPERKHQSFMEAIKKYTVRKIVSVRYEFVLREKIEKTGNEFSKAFLGGHLFSERTLGRKSIGKIEAERRGPYFVVAFSQKEDYDQFLSGSSDVSEDFLSSGGTYHRALKLEASGDEIHCLAINGNLGDSSQVVDHEKRHFLNNQVFGDFKDLDSEPELARVKDEVLAYMVGGLYGLKIGEVLRGPLYNHLFKEFTKERSEEIKKLVDEIDRVLGDLQFCSGLDNKIFISLLCYLLVDVPLSKFPDRLRSISSFYSKKFFRFTPNDREITGKQRRVLIEKGLKDEFVTKSRQIAVLRDNNARLLLGIILNKEDELKLKEVEDELSNLKKELDNILKI